MILLLSFRVGELDRVEVQDVAEFVGRWRAEGIVLSSTRWYAERHDRTDGLNKLKHRAGAAVSARSVLKIRLQETILEKQTASYVC